MAEFVIQDNNTLNTIIVEADNIEQARILALELLGIIVVTKTDFDTFQNAELDL